MVALTFMAENDVDSTVTLNMLQSEEHNVLYARRLAERRKWWPIFVNSTRSLTNFYSATGRIAEHGRLVRATVDRLIDPVTLKSREGSEAVWIEAMVFAHSLACREHRTGDANRLYAEIVAHTRRQLGDLQTCVPAQLSAGQRELARGYLHASRIRVGSSVTRMARDEFADAARLGEEAHGFACRLEMMGEAAALALHLGHCYTDMGGEQNLSTAEDWYRSSLKDTDPKNIQALGMCMFELAQLKYARFQIARQPNSDPAVVRQQLSDALVAARSAQEAIPDRYPGLQMRINHLLGNILDDAGFLSGNKAYQDQAADHYEKAIQIADRINNDMEASMLCREMARLKAKLGDVEDALVYADSAVRRAERLGPSGAHAVERSRQLAHDIGQLPRKKRGP
jgi:tetratricopeptide (TPR) repeat protein